MHTRSSLLMLAPVACLLASCGGGDGGDTGTQAATASATNLRRTALAVTGPQRIAAAKKTASSSTNACAAIQPFYWEIGGATAGSLASGSVNSPNTTTTYDASTRVDLASSSKWLYGAYIAQRRAGVLTANDIKYLTLRSGYTNLSQCYPSQTVNGCLYYQTNEQYDPTADGKFFYNGGHMQMHASNIGLGPLSRLALATEITSQIGGQGSITYDVALLAGGGTANATNYAAFLRRMMSGQLVLGSLLGSNAVCTNPATCPTQAIQTPTPPGESWHYSIGHWVEDDPVVGDGSYSSPGTKGFYPWISADHSIYGIISRQDDVGTGFTSVDCGRAIRKAWQTGVVQ
jgi:hypothetical protein